MSERQGRRSGAWGLIGLLTILLVVSRLSAAEVKVDLDGNPANGAESTVETNVLQSFPVTIENVIFNNAIASGFSFTWPGAGPGGFDSILNPGPDVGTKWEWSTVSQVYSIQAPAVFVEQARQLPTFGGFGGSFVSPGSGDRSFLLPGKSIFPTQVTVSSASLTASLITFFSPENTIATCESTFAPGVFQQTITNTSGEPLILTVEQPDCCLEPQQIVCDDICVSYQTDVNNCGDCGITCALDEFCDAGSCAPICPGAGQEYCNGVCVDTYGDADNCGGCGISCAGDEFCDVGTCAPICPGADQELCNGLCVDTFNDDANCGGCDITCALDEYCDAGGCAPICPGVGEEYCSGVCVDTLNDDNNCGGCDITCALDEYCDTGSCQSICPVGMSYCNGACVDLQNDPLNCGACANVCASNDVCEEGGCNSCQAPLKTNCNNECVNTNTDPFNCGECGNVCDFSNCPSSGQGTCSQGLSCQCLPAAGAEADLFLFAPTPTEAPPVSIVLAPAPRATPKVTREQPPSRKVEPTDRADRKQRSSRLRTEAIGSVSEPGRIAGRRAGRATLERTAGESTTTAAATVVEAPVCEFLDPIVTMTIPDGGSFTQCQSGALVGREVFTRTTVVRDGAVAGVGPCAVIVPAPDTTINDFEPTTSSIVVIDESGDGLLQPGEEADLYVEVLNVGPLPLTNPVATISSPPDQFNPEPVMVLSGSVLFPEFPEFTDVADCNTPPVLEPQMTQTPFTIVVPESQDSNVGRVFTINLQGDNGQQVNVDLPVVIGIGEKCDLTKLNGEAYDGVEGFLSPLDSRLVPKGAPIVYSSANLNQGSNVPLKFRVTCDGVTLNEAAIDPNPQIVELIHDTLGPQPLMNINADNNSNPDDPFFDCSTNRCEFGLRTAMLPVGTYVISIQLADSRVFQGGFTIVP